MGKEEIGLRAVLEGVGAYAAGGKTVLGVNKQMLGSIQQTAFQGGTALTAGLTLPIVGVAAIAVKSFASFDAAMTKSLAIMGDVSDEMRGTMAQTARDVAKTLTISANDAAEAYFFLASAGLDATASVAALPAVAKFAQAGMFDMATATDLLTDAQSALGLTVRDDAVKNLENMVLLGDQLVKANTLANASVQQFSESLTNRAAVGLALVNKGAAEGLAVLAVFADKGVKGAEAGTRLDIVLRDLQNAQVRNTAAWKEFNITSFDANGNMREMGPLVRDLTNLLGPMNDATKRATLLQLGFSDRSVASLLVLLGTGDQIEKYQEQIENAGGATQTVAEKQLETFNAKMTLLKNRVNDAFITLGMALVPMIEDRLVPAIEKGAEIMAKLADEFAALPKPLQLVIVGVLGVLAALGPLLLMVGVMAFALGAILPLLPAIGVAFAIMTGPIALVVIALAALIIAGILVVKHWEELKEIASFYWEGIKEVVTGATKATIDFLKKNWPLIVGIMAGPLGLAILAAFKWRDQIVAAFAGAFKWVKSLLGKTVEKINDFLRGLFEKGQAIPGEMASGLRSGVGNFFSAIARMVSDAIKLLNPFNWVFGSDMVDVYEEIGEDAGVALVEALDREVAGVSGVVDNTLIPAIEAARQFVDALHGELGRLLSTPTLEGAEDLLRLAELQQAAFELEKQAEKERQAREDRIDTLGDEKEAIDEELESVEDLLDLAKRIGDPVEISRLETRKETLDKNRLAIEDETEALQEATGAAEKQLKAIEDQIDSVQRSIEKRQLEANILRARGLVADDTLLSDNEMMVSAERLITSIGNVTGEILSQIGVIRTQYIPTLSDVEDAMGDAGGAMGGAEGEASSLEDFLAGFDASAFTDEIDGAGDTVKTFADLTEEELDIMREDWELFLEGLGIENRGTWEEILLYYVDGVKDIGGELDKLWGHFENLYEKLSGNDPKVKARKWGESIIEGLREGLQGLGYGGIGDFFTDPLGPILNRQHGGPLRTGQTSVVGEAGPELFVPSQSGAILPNDLLRGFGSMLSGVTGGNGGLTNYGSIYISAESPEGQETIRQLMTAFQGSGRV